MSLVTQMMIFDRYGPLLDKKALGDLLGYAEGTVENMVNGGTFPIPTTKRGARIVAHYADVAAYIDSLRSVQVDAKRAA